MDLVVREIMSLSLPDREFLEPELLTAQQKSYYHADG
jgi:hypothetical protein